ncbi:MAG: O-antigen ligase family protein [Planctomycetota bacterium]
MVRAAIFLTILSFGFNQGWYHNGLQTDVIRLSDFFCGYLLLESLGRSRPGRPVGRWIAVLGTLFLLWGFAGYLGSVYNSKFWRQWLDVLRSLLTFTALARSFDTERRLMTGVWALATLAGLEAVIGLLQWKFGALGLGSFGFETYGGGRVSGTFVHPNMMGTFMAGVLPLLSPFVLDKNRHFGGFAISVMLVVAGLVLTFSRTGWAAGFAGVCVVMFFAVLSRRAAPAALMMAVLAMGASAGFLVLKYPDMILARIETAASEVDTDHPASRLSLALEAIEMIEERPITGIGMGNYEDEVWNQFNLRTHTTYLYVAAETGLIGFLLYIMIPLGIFFCALRDRWSRNDNAARLAIGVLGALTAIGIASLTDLSPWADATILQFFWTLLALGVASHRLALEHDETTHESMAAA